MRKIFLLFLGFFLLTGCGVRESDFKSTVPVEPFDERVVGKELPGSVNLDAPFFPQAPDGNWELPWQEACEEASVILAFYGIKNLPLERSEFREKILTLVDWQNQHFGAYEHTTIAQTAQMLESVFGYADAFILDNPSINDFKRELGSGHVIVAPFAGRELGNPFYSGEGPYYHMMVIRGYDEQSFITNDVGTKRGENFVYSYQTLMNALHDWHDEDISLGVKRVLVLR